LIAHELWQSQYGQQRLAAPQHAAVLVHVQITSYRTAYALLLPASFLAQFLPEEQTQNWHDRVAANNDAIVYVAEAGTGEIAGYPVGRPRARGGARFASELVAVYVLPSHQRQSVERGLFVCSDGDPPATTRLRSAGGVGVST
jgi:hypothetical protein